MDWSVVMCSNDDRRFAATSAMYESLLAGLSHELVRIRDARSMAEGYNRGIAQSRGERLILAHDDLEILDRDLAGKLSLTLDQFDLVGLVGATRVAGPRWFDAGPPFLYGQLAHPVSDGYEISTWAAPSPVVGGMQALDGVFLCATRRLVCSVPFDETIFDGFHLYDVDFSFTAHLRGFGLAVRTDIPAIHHSAGDYGADWQRHADRFRAKHREALPAAPPVQFVQGLCFVRQKQDVIPFFSPPHFPGKRQPLE